VFQTPRIQESSGLTKHTHPSADGLILSIHDLSEVSSAATCRVTATADDEEISWSLPASMINTTHVECLDATEVLVSLRAGEATVELLDPVFGLRSLPPATLQAEDVTRPAPPEAEPAALAEFATLLSQNISATSVESATTAADADQGPGGQTNIVVAGSTPALPAVVVEASPSSPISHPRIIIAGWGFAKGNQHSLLLSSIDRNVTFETVVTAESDLLLVLDFA